MTTAVQVFGLPDLPDNTELGEPEAWRGLPPLTGSTLLDPWRIRHRLELVGQLSEPQRRTGATRTERLLWERLDALDAGWMREYATGPYRLDFYLPSARLAVEVDGASHYGRRQAERDALRDVWHAVRGITTLRISVSEVERDLDWVVSTVLERAAQNSAEARATAAEPTTQALSGEIAPVAVNEGAAAPLTFGRADACATVLPDFTTAMSRFRRLLQG
ncbi:MAG: hypothetical protein JWN87_722 [Frankiales bacterium]|nr:hypothetical protein [Frankiales bacterium]